jgi:hypothetical protein
MDPSSKSPDDDDLRPEAEAARRPQPQPQPREWRFAQVFGERAAGEDVQEGENAPTRPLPLLAACVAWLVRSASVRGGMWEGFDAGWPRIPPCRGIRIRRGRVAGWRIEGISLVILRLFVA